MRWRGRERAIEEAAKIAEDHSTHEIRGICLGDEIAAELPTDGDPIAPFLRKGSGVEKLVNAMCHSMAHIIAANIRRALAAVPGKPQEE